MTSQTTNARSQRSSSRLVRLLLVVSVVSCVGCMAIPDVRHRPKLHNPFPQLHRVAVMPFNNLSQEPTVDGRDIANKYFTELQQIPGFEVIPVGVVEERMRDLGFPAQMAVATDYRKLADSLGADAIVIGAITEFQIYRPSRIGLTIRWYATNPGFHPIPAGYGLPWGTADEEFIPDSLVQEAEFELARKQLATQTPSATFSDPSGPGAGPPGNEELTDPAGESTDQQETEVPMIGVATGPGALPPDWPDPRGFVPRPPSPTRLEYKPQFEPIMSLTRLYDSNDADFTQRLANYYYFRDDARFGGWQSYLSVTDDFIQFCCHLHISEMLASRGGAGKTQVVWRWPIDRYER